jgi:NitT/TauT family transport system substrate-binding protein
LQRQVDVISIYRSNDLPILEARTGTKFVLLDLAQNGLAIPGLAAVSSDAIIARKPDVLKRYLAAVNEGIEATRKDPKAAAAALVKVSPGGPTQDIVEAQVRASMEAVQSEPGKPIGWVDAKTISQSLELLKSDEAIGTPKPVNVFYTNDLLGK